MAVKKILAACGSGLGSSFLVEMNIQKVLDKLGKSDIEVGHTSTTDIHKGAADLYVVGNDLKDEVSAYGPVIALSNIISLQELEEKLTKYFEENE